MSTKKRWHCRYRSPLKRAPLWHRFYRDFWWHWLTGTKEAALVSTGDWWQP